MLVHLPDDRLRAADEAADVFIVLLAFICRNAKFAVDRRVKRQGSHRGVNILHDELREQAHAQIVLDH